MKKIAVLVPVCNEEETLGKVLGGVQKELYGHEVLLVVVDDGSKDGSVAVARAHTPHVVALEENCGVGTATRKGLEYIADLGKDGDIHYVVKLDGDGQHTPEFLPRIIAELNDGNSPVICSRFHPASDQKDTPVNRILLNMTLTGMVRKITGWKLTDARSGYMGFHFADAWLLSKRIITPRYGVPMELLLRVWHKRQEARIAEISHPALYGGYISEKIRQKYLKETAEDMARRLQEQYLALLRVLEDIPVPRERILEMNGFATRSARTAIMPHLDISSVATSQTPEHRTGL